MKDNYLIPVIPFNSKIIAKGEKSYIFDTEGKRYLDINSGQFCSILGNSNKEVADYMYHNVLNKIQHTCTSMLSEDVINTAVEVNRISGEMNAYSIMLSTGAEVVEFCMRYAKHLTGKSGIICFNKGYHGLSLGAQSITYEGIYSMPHVPYTYSVTVPDTFLDEEGIMECLSEVKKVVENYGDNIAAMLFEPIASVGGMVIPHKLYFEKIREICDENNILLIFDECQTGFGRTGTWFYYQQLGCIPDMVACAKGIGLGYPVSLALMRETLIPHDGFSMTHYSSHQNDSFAAGIISYGIQHIEEKDIMKEVKEKGDYFLKELQKLSEKISILINPRGKGLMLGIDLHLVGIEDYRSIMNQIVAEAQEEGLILQSTNAGQTLRFLPSYMIEYEEIDFCIDVLQRICKKFEKLYGVRF